MIRKYLRRFGASVAGLCLLASGLAHAAEPIRLVVGFPAGGGGDTIARIIADGLSTELQQTVIVENRPGAGGAIAAANVKSSPADGLTALVVNSHMMATGPLTTKSPQYHPLKDFKTLGRVTSSPIGIVAPGGTFASFKDWLEAAKSAPKNALYAIPAPGSPLDFIGYRLGVEAKVKLSSVPYKGAAPMIQDLIGKQVPIGITTLPDLIQHHKDGRLKVLAVTGAARSAQLPEVPTLKELGYEGFERTEWVAVVVRASTPADKTERLATALGKVMAQARTGERLLQSGNTPAYLDAEKFSPEVARDYEFWESLVKASGFTPN